ncbi:MAG: PDZ domain-containing protein [Nocardioidaceae bacterium]|nr:PDZ domain-containing protein [Nocardioidaceae bacterium]
MTRRVATLTVASVLLIILTSVAFFLPVPYVTMEPGPTLDTLGESDDEPLIEFGPGVKTYETTGSLSLTTVSVTRPGAAVKLSQAFTAWFDPDSAIVPRDLIYPPEQSASEAEEEGVAEMSGSQQASEVAGLIEAGYDVKSWVEVSTVVPDGPADGSLQPADRIVSVDGEKVSTLEAVVSAVTARDPGDSVRLVVRRDGSSRTIDITTVADSEDADVPRIGVGLAAAYMSAVEVVYNVGRRISGPSAGTMFALAIFDKLTPGSLTGGQAIAGTGEISADGTVMSIGGIQQKISAAYEAGATIFLVPADNCEQAVGADVDLDAIMLVEIETLHEAVTSLEALVADPQAAVPTCT